MSRILKELRIYFLEINCEVILKKKFFLGFQKPAVPTPEQFVKNYGGKRAINKILLANNGIAGKFLKKVTCTFF